MNSIIIDDEEIAALALKRRVNWEKYGIDEVFMANSMRQAMEIMEKTPVNLMLCDVEMPGGSGLELYEWVRTYSPETECIFISCHPEYEYVRKALLLGSMDYILKPVDYSELDTLLMDAAERIANREKNRISSVETIADTDKTEIQNYSEPVSEAIKYINSNLEYNISISDIADTVFLNPQYFMRMFKKETGMSILEYITDCRLKRAKKMLLDSNVPINEVAMAAGYDNFAYFSKLFKKNEGVSPSDFRKNNGK